MIAARADEGTIIVGLCKADLEILASGKTLIKEGGLVWGFKGLVIFQGPSDEENLKLLWQQDTIRSDNSPGYKG